VVDNKGAEPPDEGKSPDQPSRPAASSWEGRANAAAIAFSLIGDILERGERDGPALAARTIAHLLQLAAIFISGRNGER
jgi:hypothetical protein